MDELINKLKTVRSAIQHLEHFIPTEYNCNQILASVQLLHEVEAELSKMGERSKNIERNTP